MEITIKGSEKEIAAFVVELQKQQEKHVVCNVTSKINTSKTTNYEEKVYEKLPSDAAIISS